MIRNGLRFTFATVALATTMAILSACATAPSSGSTPAPAAPSTSAPAAPAAPAWTPTSAVEFVVPFAPGGGSDNMARMIHGIMEEGKLVPQPINIANKAGGSGAVGHAYVATKKGDKNTIMTINDSIVSVPLQPDYKGPTYKDLIILGIMAKDDFLIAVPANSPYKTIEEMVAFGKANPGKLKLATAAARGEDHVFGIMIEKATGIQFNYVHANGGAEAMRMVVGGHVDLAVPNPSETLSQAQGGQVKLLAVGSAQRLGILKDIPTLKEKGVNVEFQMFRGIAAPAGAGDDVQKYWEGVLKKVVDSDKWKNDYVGKLGLTPAFAVGKDALAIVERAHTDYDAILKTIK